MKLSLATSAVLFGLSQSASAFAPSTSFAPTARGATTSLNAVSKKDSYTVTLLPGDGIGPEITAATKSVLEALCERCGFQIELKEALIGGSAIDAKNDPFPDESLEQCRNSDSVLLACIGGYKVRCSLALYWIPRGTPKLRIETYLLMMSQSIYHRPVLKLHVERAPKGAFSTPSVENYAPPL